MKPNKISNSLEQLNSLPSYKINIWIRTKS